MLMVFLSGQILLELHRLLCPGVYLSHEQRQIQLQNYILPNNQMFSL